MNTPKAFGQPTIYSNDSNKEGNYKGTDYNDTTTNHNINDDDNDDVGDKDDNHIEHNDDDVKDDDVEDDDDEFEDAYSDLPGPGHCNDFELSDVPSLDVEQFSVWLNMQGLSTEDCNNFKGKE